MANEWKERDGLEFLRVNVNRVIEIVEENRDERIGRYRTLYERETRRPISFSRRSRRENGYRRTPVNVCRHIVLSESNEIRGFLPNVSRERGDGRSTRRFVSLSLSLQDLENGQTFYSFDPFPPKDSLVGFQRPER